MRKHANRTSAFFNPRFCLALVLGLVALSLGVASLGVPTLPSGTLSVKDVIPAKVAPTSVTITVFYDSQCPYCKRAASIVEQVRRTYGERVKVVFKQMPLSMHRYAFKAAQASVCAQEQGKFWQYHDQLFASDDLSLDQLNRIAARVGLEQTAFGGCMGSAISQAVVEKDIAEANQLGVTGTPTFLV